MYKLLIYTLIFIYNVNLYTQNTQVHDVYFETAKYQLTETEKTRLLIFISNLSEVDINSISIYGFCDDRGSLDYNLKLSEQRAQAIKTFFAKQNIDENLITSVDGKGEILVKILDTEQLTKIRGLNRKVEIIVYPKQTELNDSIKQTQKNKNALEHIKNTPLKIGDKIVFDTILFEIGYSTIMPESKAVLDSIANALVKRKSLYFTIQGHVCCTKSTNDAVDKKTQKQNLSVARARFIFDYLADKGVSKRRMKYKGLGRQFPLGGDPKLDRRVEILITEIRE